MTILVISDAHGAESMLDSLCEESKKADFVLFGGDFAKYGEPETGLPFLERLAKFHDRVFAVTGNCDESDFKETMDEFDLSIEGAVAYYSGLIFSGSGGALKFTNTTPNERNEEDLADDLHLVAESVPEESTEVDQLWDNLIIIAHHPPKDTKLDIASASVHVGSTAIRSFIEKYKPLLVVSGHIHESSAVDMLGGTTLINPGPLAEGCYAVVTLSKNEQKVFSVSSVELKKVGSE